MTALACVWRLDRRPDAAESCRRILAAQDALVPRPSQVWSDADIAIGLTLTPRLPEDRFDRQPLSDADGRFVLIADARLDNRTELSRKLGIGPADERLASDAHLILSALQRWDVDCVTHLVGDFAFAAWDRSRQRLLLARDPLGFRALHLHRCERLLAVSTTARGLHGLPEVPYALDEERLIDFLIGAPIGNTRTCFAAIERVKAGHIIEISQTGQRERRFWNPGAGGEIRLGSPDEYAEALLAHLDEAVRVRLRGDSCVASHLSGGLDSSAVTTSAARQLAPAGGTVTAYTSVPRDGYDEPPPGNRIIDEGPYAAMTAAAYSNIEHALVRGSDRSPLDDLEFDVDLLEQPSPVIRNNAYIYSIADDVKQRGLRVLLTGGCGNAGWSYDGLALLPELVGRGDWRRWAKEAAAIVATRRMRWRGVTAASFGPWIPRAVWVGLQRVIASRETAVLPFIGVNPGRVSEDDIRERLKAAGVDTVGRPFRDGRQERHSMLRDIDFGSFTTAMRAGWGIDLRDPTADTRLLDFTLRVPTDQFLHDGVPKALTRLALRGRIPAQVAQEQRRGLQSADWHVSLSRSRDLARREVELMGQNTLAASLLDVPRLMRLIDAWPKDGWHRDNVIGDYAEMLLSSIAVGRFIRRVEERGADRWRASDGTERALAQVGRDTVANEQRRGHGATPIPSETANRV